MKPIDLRIAEELCVGEQQVAAAISLLDGGATVPFVARYRKEATGALDDAQLRTLEERLRYLRGLDQRRAAILDSISQQGTLDSALKHAIEAADSKVRLEDLYLPYRPKRRTKAQIAREAGLEPLAEVARPDQDPEQVAHRYVEPSKGVVDSAAALEGARAIHDGGDLPADLDRLADGVCQRAAGAGAEYGVLSAHDPAQQRHRIEYVARRNRNHHRHQLRADQPRTEPSAGCGGLNDAALETAAFTIFLYARMLGCTAEIDDHLNPGRHMDKRTPASQCRFVA
jgi:Tex-like protein N-terminal domain